MSDYIALILRESFSPLGTSRDYIEVQASTQKGAIREAERVAAERCTPDTKLRVITSFPKTAVS